MPDQQNHILIAVLGRTPQVLTETLYGLCVVRNLPIEEVWTITTREGYQEAVEKLLPHPQGKFYQLQQDYPAACGQLRFSAQQIIVAHDGLLPIADIRTRQHSESFLETIIQLLWEKSALADVALHCSLAGGRKTMSTYLALALQLLGRPQDRLYHVLIDPPELESHSKFYYPPPRPTLLALADGRTVEASQTRIDLVDIPFIRLRERIQIDRLKSPGGYRQILEWVQRDLDHAPLLPDLVLEQEKCTLRIGDSEIHLQPQRFCLYWYFADRSRARPPSLAPDNYPAYFEPSHGELASAELRDGLLRRFDGIDPDGEMRRKFAQKVLTDKGHLPMSWVLQAKSRINARIRLGLPGAYLLPFYLISAEGRRGSRCYGIKLEGRKIVTPGMGG